jgi:hypothetical protein
VEGAIEHAQLDRENNQSSVFSAFSAVNLILSMATEPAV